MGENGLMEVILVLFHSLYWDISGAKCWTYYNRLVNSQLNQVLSTNNMHKWGWDSLLPSVGGHDDWILVKWAFNCIWQKRSWEAKDNIIKCKSEVWCQAAKQRWSIAPTTNNSDDEYLIENVWVKKWTGSNSQRKESKPFINDIM